MKLLPRIARHLWLDAGDAGRALGAGGLQRLEDRVRDSERRHLGEICVCIEAGLPLRDLWGLLRRRSTAEESVRERALALFGELRVWDAELNNGVLIYVQLAEHRLEILADRGLARCVPDDAWQAAVANACDACRRDELERGLATAIDAVSAALQEHFPSPDGDTPGSRGRTNEIADRPLIR